MGIEDSATVLPPRHWFSDRVPCNSMRRSLQGGQVWRKGYLKASVKVRLCQRLQTRQAVTQAGHKPTATATSLSGQRVSSARKRRGQVKQRPNDKQPAGAGPKSCERRCNPRPCRTRSSTSRIRFLFLAGTLGQVETHSHADAHRKEQKCKRNTAKSRSATAQQRASVESGDAAVGVTVFFKFPTASSILLRSQSQSRSHSQSQSITMQSSTLLQRARD